MMNELERFRAKWIPVRVKKTRQNKNLEPRSDPIGTEKALERTCQRQPDRQRLNRMQDIVHHAVLAHRRRRRLNGAKAKIVKTVGLEQRSIGVGDLVGLGVQQVEDVELDP